MPVTSGTLQIHLRICLSLYMSHSVDQILWISNIHSCLTTSLAVPQHMPQSINCPLEAASSILLPRTTS